LIKEAQSKTIEPYIVPAPRIAWSNQEAQSKTIEPYVVPAPRIAWSNQSKNVYRAISGLVGYEAFPVPIAVGANEKP